MSKSKQDPTLKDLRSQPPVAPKGEGKQDLVAGKIAGFILRLQSGVSGRVNSFRYLKTVLIIFCVVSGSLSLYFMVEAFMMKPKTKVKVERIKSPRHVCEPAEDLFDERIPDEIYQSIQEYRRYADSTGEMIRPGLNDSMRILEEMYLQQQRKQ